MAQTKSTQKKTASQIKIPALYARIDRTMDYEGDGVKAIASVNVGGAFAVHGFKVYESTEKGRSVLNPSSKYEKNGRTEYSDVFHAITPEARTAVNEAILNAYEQKIAEDQAQDMDEETAQGQTSPDENEPDALTMGGM